DGRVMKQLWAPWRLAFIEQVSHGSGCIFCEKPANHQDGKTFILWRGRHAYVLMNIYPYTNGHLLIAPYRHIGALEDLPETVLLDMLRLVQRSIKAIRKAYAPEGFNVGVNQGKVAGAGIEHHIHLHIVPPWSSDTNFMPLLANTAVLHYFGATTPPTPIYKPILSAFGTGLLIMGLLLFPAWIKLRMQLRRTRTALHLAEEELDRLRATQGIPVARPPVPGRECAEDEDAP